MRTEPIAPAIEVRGLKKIYGAIVAVAGIDFQVHAGEIFGFLGPNAAGKTTTISILTGLARPTEGAIRILGSDIAAGSRKTQHLIGVVPDESNLYPELDGVRNLEFCGALYGMTAIDRRRRAAELLERVGLTGAARQKFETYSKGMKRKLAIAAALMHSPQILFLDEPTTGLDVVSARQVREMIADLNRDGTTIFLTTHNIPEAEQLCQRIAFIVEGRIVRTDTVAHLTEAFEGEYVIDFTLDTPAVAMMDAFHSAFPETSSEWIPPASVRVRSTRPLDIGPYVRFFEERGIGVFEARKSRSSLEDVFVRVTSVGLGIMRYEHEEGPGVT